MPRRTLEQVSTINDRAAEIITENAIVEFQPTQNQDLARTFGGIRGAIETAAQTNVIALMVFAIGLPGCVSQGIT